MPEGENKNQEKTFNDLANEVSVSLAKNLKDKMNNTDVELLWGTVSITIDSTPTSFITVDIDCEKEQFDEIVREKLTQQIKNSAQKNNLDSTSKITGISRTLFFGKKGQQDTPIESRNAVLGGGTVIVGIE